MNLKINLILINNLILMNNKWMHPVLNYFFNFTARNVFNSEMEKSCSKLDKHERKKTQISNPQLVQLHNNICIIICCCRLFLYMRIWISTL